MPARAEPLLRRYELKYLLTPGQRAAFREAVRPMLELDPHGRDGSYRVTSQYYDAPDLTWFWEKLDGISVRRKIRLRFYGAPAALEDGPAFMEIKHRRDRLIHKERVELSGEEARALLDDAQGLRDLAARVGDEERGRGAGTIRLVESDARALELRATNVISYRREAWFSHVDERLRLTFDDEVRALPPAAWREAADPGGAPLLPDGWCVMELKFDRVIPRWVRQTLATQGLRLERFSKYAEGILALRGEPTWRGRG